ncbi:MAG: hypothetical protein GF405_07075 [Candidatus Eisenbacteria bacterium]|nr:hypothetical protein [Candidatus Eisenbacteria bacterium]
MWKMQSPTKTEEQELTEREIMDRFASRIVEWRMTAPAIFFLEAAKPLSFLGNQALIFFEPIVQSLFNFKSYDDVARILEDRKNLEYMLTKLEELEAERLRKAREERRRRREEKRAAKQNAEEGADE